MPGTPGRRPIKHSLPVGDDLPAETPRRSIRAKGSAAVRIEKLNGRVYDPLEERPIRAHASQHADSEQNAEQMSGEFLGRQGRADRPLPLPFAHTSMKESFDAHQHLGDDGTVKPEIMRGRGQSMLAWPGVVFGPVCEPDAGVDVRLVWLAEREHAAAGLFIAFVRDHTPMSVPAALT
jgi:hypothetical protein